VDVGSGGGGRGREVERGMRVGGELSVGKGVNVGGLLEKSVEAELGEVY